MFTYLLRVKKGECWGWEKEQWLNINEYKHSFKLFVQFSKLNKYKRISVSILGLIDDSFLCIISMSYIRYNMAVQMMHGKEGKYLQFVTAQLTAQLK